MDSVVLERLFIAIIMHCQRTSVSLYQFWFKMDGYNKNWELSKGRAGHDCFGQVWRGH